MKGKYIRFPLSVEGKFTKEGAFVPKQIIVDGEHFIISKIVRKRVFTPSEIGCFVPIEFTVEVNGKEKKIYFESLTNKWFSVKSI